MNHATSSVNADNTSLRCCMCDSPVVPRKWGGGECDRCKSVSVTRVPTLDELESYYGTFNESYTGGGRSGGRNLARYAKRYLSIVRKQIKSGKLIDVGSSTSPFPDIAATCGYDVSVLDYAKPKELSSNVDFIEGNINNEDILVQCSDTFDVVTAWGVIEHVARPRLSCRILARMCRPGGLIFLSTPEIGTLLANYSIGRSGWFCPPEHLNLVSPVAMARAFEANGCSLIKCGRHELTAARYIARYGIGILESTMGVPFKKLHPTKWQVLRDTVSHKFQGMLYFVIRKNDA